MRAAYSYDDASRLTGIVYTKPDGTLLGDLSYRYDAAGRRIATGGTLAPTSVPEAMPMAAYGPGNRLQGWNGQAITHDANGSMTSDGTRSYTWDAKNQLASITGPESMQASFRYDAFGRRVSRTVNGIETGYVYDGINPVQELGATGASASLLTGLGVDEYYRRTDAASSRDMVTDALGSVLALADEAGQVKTTYQYEPYGATTVQGEAGANSFQYTGRENDGTGLYYYRARYYHPGLGRFVAEDPIGLAGGINSYTYVNGNPISQTDPLGLCPMCIVPALPYIPEAIVVGATWWASQQVINQNKTPNAGESGSWHTNPGSGQERKYGPDGRPELDIDWDHDHGQGSPHGHNWNNGKRDGGWPISPWPPGRKPNTCQAK